MYFIDKINKAFNLDLKPSYPEFNIKEIFADLKNEAIVNYVPSDCSVDGVSSWTLNLKGKTFTLCTGADAKVLCPRVSDEALKMIKDQL